MAGLKRLSLVVQIKHYFRRWIHFPWPSIALLAKSLLGKRLSLRNLLCKELSR
jgi:hypothetical protein